MYPTTYKITEETTDFTLATEDDEDFRLDNPPFHSRDKSNQHSASRKLNFDDSYASNSSPPLKRQSFSANTEIDSVERIDPLTFSQQGDFIRQLALKLQTFLANSPEENLILTVRNSFILFLTFSSIILTFVLEHIKQVVQLSGETGRGVQHDGLAACQGNLAPHLPVGVAYSIFFIEPSLPQLLKPLLVYCHSQANSGKD